jgi:hypothetical protein
MSWRGDSNSLLSVAKDQVLGIPERYSGYRMDLVNLLVQVISLQSTESADVSRRREAKKLVSAFGDEAARKRKGTGK